MTLVEMYSKEECHLCDVARDALKKVQEIHPFELKEIKLCEGDKHFEGFKERIPVIFVDHELAFQYRVEEKQLLEKLQSLAAAR